MKGAKCYEMDEQDRHYYLFELEDGSGYIECDVESCGDGGWFSPSRIGHGGDYDLTRMWTAQGSTRREIMRSHRNFLKLFLACPGLFPLE